jgi:hypothetical protein
MLQNWSFIAGNSTRIHKLQLQNGSSLLKSIVYIGETQLRRRWIFTRQPIENKGKELISDIQLRNPHSIGSIMQALARLQGPNAPIPEFMSISLRMGPFAISLFDPDQIGSHDPNNMAF